MAKKAKVVEEIKANELPVAEKIVTPEEEAKEQAPKREETKVANAPEEEAIFLSPHDVYRVQQDGVVESVDNFHVVLRGADGKKYALAFDAATHKDLKAGDAFKF